MNFSMMPISLNMTVMVVGPSWFEVESAEVEEIFMSWREEQ
jgi:hypothetical protein